MPQIRMLGVGAWGVTASLGFKTGRVPGECGALGYSVILGLKQGVELPKQNYTDASYISL